MISCLVKTLTENSDTSSTVGMPTILSLDEGNPHISSIVERTHLNACHRQSVSKTNLPSVLNLMPDEGSSVPIGISVLVPDILAFGISLLQRCMALQQSYLTQT